MCIILAERMIEGGKRVIIALHRQGDNAFGIPISGFIGFQSKRFITTDRCLLVALTVLVDRGFTIPSPCLLGIQGKSLLKGSEGLFVTIQRHKSGTFVGPDYRTCRALRIYGACPLEVSKRFLKTLELMRTSPSRNLIGSKTWIQLTSLSIGSQSFLRAFQSNQDRSFGAPGLHVDRVKS